MNTVIIGATCGLLAFGAYWVGFFMGRVTERLKVMEERLESATH